MPSSGPTNSYGNIITIPEFTQADRVTNSNNGIYICPDKKKAKVKASMFLNALGSDATYAVALKKGVEFFPVARFTIVGETSDTNGVIAMAATDILTMIGDSGSTNGTGDMVATIQEVTI